jgi:cell division protein FtsI/penicillin-binding protein 2
MALTRFNVKRSIRLLLSVLAVLQLSLPARLSPAEGGPSLFSQTAQAALDRRFTSPDISYLLLDAASGEILAQRWEQPQTPIPMGSLIKPFTAAAYARVHGRFPVFVCRGQRDGCWLPRGHGRMTVDAAIAESCNAYFLSLSLEISASEANALLLSYSLPPVRDPVRDIDKARMLTGLSADWRVSPLALAQAYLRLVRDCRRGPCTPIVYGMRESASTGTSRALARMLPGVSVLAKTGTAECEHVPRATADGFSLVLYPADSPRVLLLTRVHGVTGAVATKTTAQILKTVEEGQP